MAESDFSTQPWGPMSSGSGFQGSEVATPLTTHPHLSTPPFQQHWYDTSYGHFDSISMHRAANAGHGGYGTLAPGRSPYAPGGGYQMYYQHHASNTYGFLPTQPRLPPAFRGGTNEARMNFEGVANTADPFYRADQSTLHGSQPLQPMNNQAYAVPTNTMMGLRSHEQRRQRFPMMSAPGSPPQYMNRDGPPPSSDATGSQDHSQPMYSPHRRFSYREHQSSIHRAHDVSERRSVASLEHSGGHPGRSSSPRSSNRRSFDRYQFDLSQSSTSSDADEAAARVPPSSRIRVRPREVRPRFYGQHQHVDPNIATPRQIQELKARLPRRLPSELSEETSKACDICQKDYSTVHVKAIEEEEIAIELPCGHVFGEFCIFEWFDTCKTHKNKVTCPMCRKQLIEPMRYPPAVLSIMSRHPQAFQELLANELRGDFAHV
ncbi:Ubiquitin-protein ligase [Coniothyrium glycines]